MKNKLLNWKYYLQFLIPMKFKIKRTNETWWMWMGKCFFIKNNSKL